MIHLWKKTLAASIAAIAASIAPGTLAAIPGGSLDPTTVPKYQQALIIPPEMPHSTSDATVDYQIAVRQFQQQILPPGLPKTTVWSYGSIDHPGTVFEGGTFHYPALTIEALSQVPVKVKWVNDLKDPVTGTFLHHLLPVDQTLHWANPPQLCAGGMMTTDCRGFLPGAYTGPVPIITHLHGSHVDPESDGFPEAWYLPAATNIPGSYARRGSDFGQVAGAPDVQGQAIFRYRNDQPATTLWYHDHTLGMTRVNVYAGPAGFYHLRGRPGLELQDGDLPPGVLPGPAPRIGDPAGTKYYEIPIAIQDRSFNKDGSLFYTPNRTFFDGFTGPFAPASDVSRIWNPEFFGNMIVVNGRTWPYLNVEPRKYRFRFLNGNDSRFYILTTANHGLTFWQIGAEGGFLEHPVPLTELLIGNAERADVIVDFSSFSPGQEIELLNVGPDEPFGGGTPYFGCETDPNAPADCFEPSDPETTGKVMKFKVVPLTAPDTSVVPAALPPPPTIPPESYTRKVSLNEADSASICVNRHDRTVPCTSPAAVDAFGPVAAHLGTVDGSGFPEPLLWMDAITEQPVLGTSEVWEIFNFTADAHPIHIHMVQFEVVNRQQLVTDDEGITLAPATLVPGTVRPPEPWETGRKDTVIVYPGEVARVRAFFDIAGQFVWHCHITSHEDNEMMRPYEVVAQ